MESPLEFLIRNKEWIFSGVGVFAIATIIAIFRWAFTPRKGPLSSEQPAFREDLLEHKEPPPDTYRELKLPEPTAKPKALTFCTQCGAVAGNYSYCLKGRAHNFKRFSLDASSIHCTRCGKSPGSYSYCLKGGLHNYE
jgi:hypothetical protein